MKNYWIKLFRNVGLFVISFLLIVFFKLSCSSYFSLKNAGVGGLIREKKIDYLFIGSSHVRSSYHIPLIEKNTGKKGYAFSYAYFSYPFVYQVLEYLLNDLERSPSHVVIDIYSLIFLKKKSFVDTRFFFDCPLSLKLRVLNYIWNNYHDLGPKQYFEIIVSSENETFLTFPISNYFVSSVNYKGSYLKKHLPGVSLETFSNFGLDKNHFSFGQIRESEMQGLSKIIDLLNNKKNIKVSFIEAPLPKKIKEMSQVIWIKNQLKNFIENKGLRYIDASELEEFQNLGPAHFMDENHLSTVGRQIFSEKISELINNSTI